MDKDCNFAFWKGFTCLKVRGKGQIIEVIILLLLFWVTETYFKILMKFE